MHGQYYVQQQKHKVFQYELMLASAGDRTATESELCATVRCTGRRWSARMTKTWGRLDKQNVEWPRTKEKAQMPSRAQCDEEALRRGKNHQPDLSENESVS